MFYTYIKCSKHTIKCFHHTIKCSKYTIKCFHHTIKCSTINFLSFYFLNNRNLLNILVSIGGKIFYTTNLIYYTIFRTYYVTLGGNDIKEQGLILYNRKYLCRDIIFYDIPQNYMPYHRRTYRQSIIRNLTKQSSCEAR